MKRIGTGIKGLDELMDGGIPERDLILLSGVCGSGKTIFGLQFLVYAARTEPGIFVSFEQEIDQIRLAAQSFGWETDYLESQGRLRFLKYDPFGLEDVLELLENNIHEMRAKRVVIDSVSALGMYIRDPSELRRMILLISNIMRKNNCTAIIISETLDEKSLSRFSVEEFVSDGVIVLYNAEAGGEYRRGIAVRKMRLTEHSMKIHPCEIKGGKNGGVIVHSSKTLRR